MGTITESFGNLGEYLLAEHQKSKRRALGSELLLSAVLKPYLPSAIRCAPGTVVDIKDRQTGPFDVVAATDNFPPFSEGSAATFPIDGVLFVLQVKNWKESDLTHFGEVAAQLRKLERKKRDPIACLAVSFEALSLPEVTQFLGSKSGRDVDGILCVGHHFILRNASGLYGDPGRVPFVTEAQGASALKAFTFYLMRLSQGALGQPFGLSEYQHL